jgi:hypothetical protein
MLRTPIVIAALAALLVAGCRSGGANPVSQPSGLAEHSLAGLAAQHVAVLPTYAVRIMPGLSWTIGRPLDVQRRVDAEILSAMAERGLRKQWLFPEDLQASYRRNSTYAADPYALAEEPLRAPSFSSDTRLPEPLATQIRTLVALHQDVRLVLAPVELRFEKAGGTADLTTGRGVLRVVLLDSRLSSVFWSGEVSSDTASAFGPAIAATIASRLASAVAPQ